MIARANILGADGAGCECGVTPAVSPAMLEIEVDHKFAEAHLSIWVDDSLTYTRVLEGTDKKRLVVFHHVQGHELHAMQVSHGKHRLRVRVTSDVPTSATSPPSWRASLPAGRKTCCGSTLISTAR